MTIKLDRQIWFWITVFVCSIFFLPRSGLTCIEFFNGSNPTGHYVLDLARPVENILAGHVLRVAQWEVEHAKVPSLAKKNT